MPLPSTGAKVGKVFSARAAGAAEARVKSMQHKGVVVGWFFTLWEPMGRLRRFGWAEVCLRSRA